jgi:TonB family protein
MRTLIHLATFVLSALIVLGVYTSALAQNPLTAKVGGIPVQPVSPAADSDRVRDGLAGPVRRVRTEVAKLLSVAGRASEEKRVVLEVASYDLKGAKTENQYFPVVGSTLTGKEVYKYDERGNISEMTVVSEKGSLLSKEVYKYDYDSVGNWTKMTTSVAVIEGGNVTFEPTEVTYRSIMYYLDENMLKMTQPASSVANGATASVKVPEINLPTVVPPVPKPRVANRSANSKSGAHKTAPTLPNARISADSSGTSNSVGVKLGTTSDPGREPIVVAMASEPPPPPATKTISGGALNGRALSLPPPSYPDPAKRAHLSGVVTVEVVVDETGKVISAQATAGPSMLREPAVQAALKARFSPTLLSGQPVKVTGAINYKFTLAQ